MKLTRVRLNELIRDECLDLLVRQRSDVSDVFEYHEFDEDESNLAEQSSGFLGALPFAATLSAFKEQWGVRFTTATMMKIIQESTLMQDIRNAFEAQSTLYEALMHKTKPRWKR